MKAKKILIRVIVLIICLAAVIFQVLRIGEYDLHGSGMWLFVIGIAVPVMIGWGMIDGIKKVIRESNDDQPGFKKYTQEPISAKEAEELREAQDGEAQMYKEPTKEFKDALYLVAGLLSDHDPEVAGMMGSYESGDWSQHFEEVGEETDFFEIFLLSLNKGGFLGFNDWKFSLEDFVFNSQSAFDYYGIDTSRYEEIEGKGEICAPEAFQEMKRYLPEGYGVGIIMHDSDTYHVVVAPQEKLEEAKEIMNRIGEDINIIKLGVIEEI